MKSEKIFSDGIATVNQLLPHRNKWAYELFLIGQQNNWMPTEISMSKDIEQWRSHNILTEDERLLLRRCLGFFAGSESLVANNLLMNIFRYVSDPECRQYILRQAYEEALHNQTIIYICDSLNLDIDDVYEAYKNIPSIKAKDDFLMRITSDTNREGFSISSIRAQGEVLRNIITYYIVCEGIFFYAGFAMLLSFGRQNKMPGVSQQIQYSLRDESVHLKFGVQLINTIIQQEPNLWTQDFISDTVEHIRTAVDLEIKYVHDVLPRGILGLNTENFIGYMQYIANRRLESIGLDIMFPSARNPFQWMTEVIDLDKQKNFFETRVTNYAVGQMVDDLD